MRIPEAGIPAFGEWYPLPTILLKALSSAGFAGWVCQNLDVKELRYQNLQNKRLRMA
jgi:hypothetical protein